MANVTYFFSLWNECRTIPLSDELILNIYRQNKVYAENGVYLFIAVFLSMSVVDSYGVTLHFRVAT